MAEIRIPNSSTTERIYFNYDLNLCLMNGLGGPRQSRRLPGVSFDNPLSSGDKIGIGINGEKKDGSKEYYNLEGTIEDIKYLGEVKHGDFVARSEAQVNVRIDVFDVYESVLRALE
jgi:hypothetical protein